MVMISKVRFDGYVDGEDTSSYAPQETSARDIEVMPSEIQPYEENSLSTRGDGMAAPEADAGFGDWVQQVWKGTKSKIREIGEGVLNTFTNYDRCVYEFNTETTKVLSYYDAEKKRPKWIQYNDSHTGRRVNFMCEKFCDKDGDPVFKKIVDHRSAEDGTYTKREFVFNNKNGTAIMTEYNEVTGTVITNYYNRDGNLYKVNDCGKISQVKYIDGHWCYVHGKEITALGRDYSNISQFRYDYLVKFRK